MGGITHVVLFHLCTGEQYAKLVFRSGDSASLWSLKAIYSMCEMEQILVSSLCLFVVRPTIDK